MTGTPSRRVGRFAIPAAWAHSFSTDAKRIMGLCIVVRAEYIFAGDVIEYTALSEHFRSIPSYEITPLYQWYFTEDGDMWAEETSGAQQP